MNDDGRAFSEGAAIGTVFKRWASRVRRLHATTWRATAFAGDGLFGMPVAPAPYLRSPSLSINVR